MATNDKVEAFSENLWSDLFWGFLHILEIDIENARAEETERCIPDTFYCDIILVSRDIILMLKQDIHDMPALLLCCEEFFKKFSHSVCLKLVSDTNHAEVGFLKVMGFLMLVASVSLANACYRHIYDIPIILQKLLQEHIKTKFYEENGFHSVSTLCEKLAQNRHWLESTAEEIRTCMKESLETELPATDIRHPFYRDRAKVKIVEIIAKQEVYKSESGLCRYCNVNCISFLRQFFGPRIRYKPLDSQKK